MNTKAGKCLSDQAKSTESLQDFDLPPTTPTTHTHTHTHTHTRTHTHTHTHPLVLCWNLFSKKGECDLCRVRGRVSQTAPYSLMLMQVQIQGLAHKEGRGRQLLEGCDFNIENSDVNKDLSRSSGNLVSSRCQAPRVSGARLGSAPGNGRAESGRTDLRRAAALCNKWQFASVRVTARGHLSPSSLGIWGHIPTPRGVRTRCTGYAQRGYARLHMGR